MKTIASPLGPDDMLALMNVRPQPVPTVDPRRAQMLALFDKCDERAKQLLLRLGAIHAREYPKA